MCSGNLLENDGLVETLKDVVHTAGEVKTRLSEAVHTSEGIAQSRLKYERVMIS